MHISIVKYAFALLFVLGTGVVYAQDTAEIRDIGSTTPLERQEALEMRQTEHVEEVPERRTALSEQVQNRIRNLAANVINRLTAALNRMDAIIVRLDSRITKMGVEVDTTQATSKLADTKMSLERARLSLSTISSIDVAVVSETPRASYQTIRAQLVAVRDEIRTIHTLLRETVALLKDAMSAPQTDTETEESEESLSETH